jgi:hypothetical protein
MDASGGSRSIGRCRRDRDEADVAACAEIGTSARASASDGRTVSDFGLGGSVGVEDDDGGDDDDCGPREQSCTRCWRLAMKRSDWRADATAVSLDDGVGVGDLEKIGFSDGGDDIDEYDRRAVPAAAVNGSPWRLCCGWCGRCVC